MPGRVVNRPRNRRWSAISSTTSAMRIISVLFTVILFFVPSRGLTYVDGDESSDNWNKESDILPSRAAIERVPHQFERYKIHVPVRDAVEKLPSKKDPSPSKYRLASGSTNVFCHLDSTQYHKNQIPQKLEQIVLSSCTHILFSSIDTNFDTIANNWYSSQSNGTFASIARLKKKNPSTKILLLINEILPESVSFSRRDFIISVSEVLKTSGFDGLVLSDVAPSNYNEFGEDENIKEEFPLLIEELASVLKQRGWSLSLIVPPMDQTSRNYDTKRIILNLDFIILKSFDFRQDNEKIIGHHAPLYSAVDRDPSSKYRNVDYMVKHWIHNGADPNQIIVGVALFGRSFRLTDPKNFQPGSRTNGDGYAGRWTKTSGFLSYYEVCDRAKKDDWRQYSDKSGSPFVVRKDQWISYENHHSLTKKLEYMEKLSLGGVMLWSLDSDDFNGLCGTPWPLVTTVKTYISNVNKKNSMANDLRETPLQYDLNKKVVCYFASWSWYRYGEGKFAPEYIDKNLCTHVVYAFASLDPNDLTITSGNEWEDFENKFYERLVSNSKSEDIKVMISMGGWTDSAGDKYSKLISSGTTRRNFVNSAVAFLRKYNFNGLHLDWNYPVCWQADCTQGPTSDKTNFVKLIQELKSEFNKQDPPFELSAAISGYEEIIKEAYDFPSLSEYLDFMSIMTYDYHGSWENFTGHVSPAYYKDGDEFPTYNMDSTIKLVRKLGADPSKIVVGLPFYGQTYTLSSNSEHGLGDPAKGSGYPGEYTQQPGMLAYYEICNRVSNEKWQVSRDKNNGFDPYAYEGNQWVSYDDEISIKLKSEYIVKQELGGAMVWTIDLDDFNNICCRGSYPLLTKVNEVFKRIPIKSSNLICNKPDYPTTPSYQIPTTTEEGQGSWEEQPSSTVSTTQPTRPTTISTTQSPTRPTTQFITKPQTRPSTTTTTTSTTTTTTPSATSTTTATEPTIDEVIENEQQTTHKPSVNRPWWSEYHTQRPEQQESCKPGTYQSSKDSCQNYYQCKNGRYRKYACKDGLLWNRNANKCDSLRNVDCNEPTNSQISEVTTTTTKKPVTTSRPTTVRPTPTWRPTTTTVRPVTTWRPTTTTAKPFTTWRPTTTTQKYRKCVEGEYVAAIGDCTSYFVCTYGYFVRQFCSAGLAWNDQKKMCDWKYNVYCNYQRSNSIFMYTSMLVKSSVECQEGEFASHSGDCNKYLQCLWGKFKVNSCPAGLYWNNRLKLCDWPMNSGCMPSQEINTYPTNEPEIPLSPSQPSITEPTTKPTTSKPIITKPTTSKPIPTKPTTSKPTTSTSTTTVTSELTTEENYIPWKPTTGIPTTEDPWAWKPTTTTAATLPTTQSNYHLTGQYKVVCYFTNWAWYRPSPGKFFPEDTDPNLCTHVVYGFATLDYTDLVIRVFDSWADIDNGFYERVVALKRRGVKVSIGLGGWNDSAGDKYSRLVNNRASRKKFINNVLDFMYKYGFEGLDVDWEYPKCWQTNCDQGPESDKNAFSNFLIELKQAFKPYGYLLSAAVSPSKVVIDSGYDVPILNQYLDWIGVMTYDYHGQWDKKTGHVAPIYHHPEDDIAYFNLNYTVHYWIEKGASSRKIVLGFPLYGQSFTLSNPKVHGLNAPSSGAGEAGPFTRSAGFIAYYEICRKLASEQWTIVQDPQNRMGPYAYKGNQWVGFDDVQTVAQKAEYVKSMNLGGAMIWALDLDDYRNLCGQGHYPLLSTIMRTLGQKHGHPNTTPMIPVTNKPTTSTTTLSSPHYNTSTTEVSTTTLLPTRPTKPTYTRPPTTITTTTTTTTTTTPKPTTTVKPSSTEYFKVVCYFTNWAWYRHSGGKYLPSDIDPSLCTHIIYGFAVLDNDELVIRAHDTWADFDNFFYRKVAALKKFGVKVLLAIGGWNDSAGSKYSELVNNPSARTKFVEHVVGYLKQNDFDGLDFDWEYPKCWQVDCKRGPKSDKEGFSRLLLELRRAFDKEGFLLSAAVSPNKVVIDAGYDVPLLSETLDWISVMAYDYHGQWDKKTGHVAPMYSHPDDFDMTYNANFTLYYWVNQGADPRKLIMGMPMYGQSFSLGSSKNNGLNAPTYGGGEAGEATRSRGFLSYYEICHKVLKRDWQLVQDPLGRMGPYAYSGNQWVSFDDQDMIRFKSEFVVRNDLGGAMIWALDLDDFKNVCGCETYPLLKTINRVLGRLPGPGPDCYLDQERNDLDGVVIDNSDIGYEEELGRGQCIEPLLRGHGTDCNKYVICEFGTLLEQSCPSNLYFNKMNMLCDWPENVNCTEKKRVSSSHRQTQLLH